MEEETRTIETRLSHPQLYPILDALLSYFARLRHLVWRDLIIKCMPINELKRSYIADFSAKARQFNSLAKEQSLEDIAKERSAKLETGIRSITKAEKTTSQCHKDLKAIQSYRQKVKAWCESFLKEKNATKSQRCRLRFTKNSQTI